MRLPLCLTLCFFVSAMVAHTKAQPAHAALPAVETPAKATPTQAPHELKQVRVRPLADSLRVILMFDGPAPYTLRENLENQRAEIELINARVNFLPENLARLNDPRLTGLWLKQVDPGLVTLELRLPSSKIKIEHFAMDDPAAIVIDLSRTDASAAQVSTRPELIATPLVTPMATPEATPQVTPKTTPEATATPLVPETPPSVALNQTPPSAKPLVGSHGSVLPITEEAADKPAPEVATPAQTNQDTTATVAQPQSQDSTTTHASQTPPHDDLEATTASLVAHQSQPLNMDYDYFPLHMIKTTSPQAEDLRQDFLGRRWATVIKKGIQYLQNHRINGETRFVLYMMAEARWQLSNTMEHPPLQDLLNFYQQALRASEGGDLGAFGHWRLAQIYTRMNAFADAQDSVKKALQSSEPAVCQRAAMLQVQGLAKIHDFDSALNNIAALDSQTSTPQARVDLAVNEGNIRLEKGDAPGAWAAYERANQIDPNWISLDKQGCEQMARAALQTGNLDKARSSVEFINTNFGHQVGADEARLALLYADILAAQGDDKTAEQIYAMLLSNMSDTPKVAAIQKKILKLHTNELMAGEGRYCLLLWHQGKIVQAMAELNRIYLQCLREGVSTVPLTPIIRTIVPSFMEYAARHDRPFEAVQAWQTYNHLLTEPALRQRCRLPLGEALENLGRDREALDQVMQYKENRPTTDTQPLAPLTLQEARLNIKAGQPRKAIPLIESLLAETRNMALVQPAYELLAQAYEKSGQELEAAQAYQALAHAPDVDAPTLGQALKQAGEIFLKKGMAVQTIELGLEALIYEKQMLEQKSTSRWSDRTGDELRLMLARAYLARKDYARETIILEDLLTRPSLSAADRAQARLMLAECKRLTGQAGSAEQIYESTTTDKNTPALWKRAASETQKIMDWNREHPDWAIDLDSTATTSRPADRQPE